MFQAPYQMQWRQHNLQIKQKPDIQLVFNFTYYHLLSFAINLRLDYLWQVIQETMNVQKNSVQKVFPQWGDWDILLGGFFSSVTNSSLVNEYLYTGIINTVSKDLLLILHASNRILIFLWKIDFSQIFHGLTLTLDMSLLSWCIIYDTQFIFFPKIEEATFTNQLNLLIL